jgi:hypothetical protein
MHMYFRLFFGMVIADLEALFMALYPSAKGGNEDLFDVVSDHPIQDVLEGVGGEAGALQL